MITDIEGIRCGHWTDPAARTGCTVVLLPSGTTAAAEVRGGAPASRELDALGLDKLVGSVDAVLLTGGSAFGLAAADGVMRWCEANGRGFPTPAGLVPIVPALAIFDLANGTSDVRPGAAEGMAACEAAVDGPIPLGVVGAGTGALVGKWKGPENVRNGGIVSATVTIGALIVSSMVVVNAFGDVDTGQGGRGSVEAIDWLRSGAPPASVMFSGAIGSNTTIGLVASNAVLDGVGCSLMAQGAHDGLARSVMPPHTRVDGDAFIAVATGEVDLGDPGIGADSDTLRLMALTAVESAIRSLHSVPRQSTA